MLIAEFPSMSIVHLLQSFVVLEDLNRQLDDRRAKSSVAPDGGIRR